MYVKKKKKKCFYKKQRLFEISLYSNVKYSHIKPTQIRVAVRRKKPITIPGRMYNKSVEKQN